MNEHSDTGSAPSWFHWGIFLAGTASIPFAIMFFNNVRYMSLEKANGLGAVGGGGTEAYMTFAFMLTFILPVTAIVLLGRSFSRGNQNRRIFSSRAMVW